MHSNRKKTHKSWGIVLLYFFLILVGLLVLLISLYFFNQINNYKGNKTNTGGNIENQMIYKLQSQKKYDNPAGKNALNYYFGTTTPVVRVVLFSDFTCPMSQNSYHKIRQLGLKYKGRVKVIFRDHPGNEEALRLSMAANCAGEEGKFWGMHDRLFQIMNTTKEPPSNEKLKLVAGNLGIDKSKFKQCLAGQETKNEIKKDLSDAEKMNVKGTPTWFFNGYKISGDMPYDLMEQIIVSLIGNKM